jgi:hypothetical protein
MRYLRSAEGRQFSDMPINVNLFSHIVLRYNRWLDLEKSPKAGKKKTVWQTELLLSQPVLLLRTEVGRYCANVVI